MADDIRSLTVPTGLSREVSAYLQTLQNMVMDLAGYREAGRRAVRQSEANRFINDGKYLPETSSGFAANGETVRLASFIDKPLVFVSGFCLPDGAGAIKVRIKDLRSDFGDWKFESECCRYGEEAVGGTLEWVAIGRRSYVA